MARDGKFFRIVARVWSRRTVILLWAAGIAAGLAVGAAVIAWIVLDSLDIKAIVARVEHAVEDATGRKLTIGAEPQLSFTPLLRLVVRDVTFSNMEGGARPEMLKLQRVEIGVKLAPLLRAERPGISIVLIEPDLLLEVDERGKGNWVLKRPLEEVLARLKEAVSFLTGRVDFDSVTMEGAMVRFDDRENGRKLSVTARRASLDRTMSDRYQLDIDAVMNDMAAVLHAAVRVTGPGEPAHGFVKATLPGMTLSAEGTVRPQRSMDGTDLKVAVVIEDATRLGKALGVAIGKMPAIKLDARLRGAGTRLQGEPLQLAVGRSTLAGSMEMDFVEPRPRLKARLEAPLLDPSEFTALTAARGGASNVAAAGRVFPATRLPLEYLTALDADVRLKAARVTLSGSRSVEAVEAHLSLTGGLLKIDPYTLATGSGRIGGAVRLDASSANTATIEVELQTKDVELDSLLKLAGLSDSRVTGARTSMTIKLKSSGYSVKSWAGALNGHARIVVGEGRLPGKLAAWTGSAVGQALDVANPFRHEKDGSALKCAVVNVPVQRGVITIKETVAAETDKIVGALSGTVDLGLERLDLILHSSSTGVGPGLADFASAVKVTGTLVKPQLAVNAKGTAVAGLRIGAAVASLGITELAGSLVRKSIPPHPCKAALEAGSAGGSENARSGQKSASATKQPGFFGRLRGK